MLAAMYMYRYMNRYMYMEHGHVMVSVQFWSLQRRSGVDSALCHAPKALGRHSSQVHGELAAEFSELPSEGVEGREALAGVGLVLDDPQHVPNLSLSLCHCWVSRLGGETMRERGKGEGEEYVYYI